MPVKIVSISVHASELSAVDQCLNLIVVGGFDAVIVHINRASLFDEEVCAALIAACPRLAGKVHINPHSAALHNMLSISRFIYDLHLAHVRNYHFAKTLFAFDWFCLDASNCLLVRPGVGSHIEELNGVEKMGTHDGWEWWPGVMGDPIWLIMRQRKTQGHHEGSFFKEAIFGRICADIERYEASLQGWRSNHRVLPEFPREEVVIPALFFSYDFEAPTRVPYVWMRWATQLTWRLDEVEGILQGATSLPPGRYGIKRVERDINDPIRMRVGAHFGYREELIASARATQPGTRID